MENTPKNVLLASQSFGYGAATEVRNIAMGLQEHGGMEDSSFYIWNTPEIRAVCKKSVKNAVLLDNHDNETISDFLARTGNRLKFDTILSSYDAQSIFYAWYKGIPCYLYDGMLSFWNTEKESADFEESVKKLEEKRQKKFNYPVLQNVFDEICSANHHDGVLLAYYLSDFNFARRADRDGKVLKALKGLGEKTMLIGAIVPPDIKYDPQVERDHVLVSLSGSIVPTVKIEDNLRYVRNILKLVSGCATLASEIPWVIAINPVLFELLSKDPACDVLPNNVRLTPSLQYEDNQKFIKKAKALLIAPGYTSLHESAYFRTPVVFLPEQNGGQPVGLNKVKQAGYPVTGNLTMAHHLGYDLEKDFDAFPMDKMYRDCETILLSPEFEKIRDEFRSHVLRVIRDDTYGHKLGEEQNHVIDRFVGGFDGVRSIAGKVKSFFDKPDSSG